MSDPCREAFEKAGYWPNEVMWKAWQQAWRAALKAAAEPSEALNLAEQWKDRADDAGRLSRAVIEGASLSEIAPSETLGPCSCQDSGRCRYVNGGPACMQDGKLGPEIHDIEGLRKRVTAAEDLLVALYALRISKRDDQQSQAWRQVRDLLRIVRPEELRAVDALIGTRRQGAE